jgi:hypothetical protein
MLILYKRLRAAAREEEVTRDHLAYCYDLKMYLHTARRLRGAARDLLLMTPLLPSYVLHSASLCPVLTPALQRFRPHLLICDTKIPVPVVVPKIVLDSVLCCLPPVQRERERREKEKADAPPPPPPTQQPTFAEAAQVRRGGGAYTHTHTLDAYEET